MANSKYIRPDWKVKLARSYTAGRLSKAQESFFTQSSITQGGFIPKSWPDGRLSYYRIVRSARELITRPKTG